MNLTANAVWTLQAVAMTVGIALLLWSTGVPTIFRSAEAASISNASDTLSDSRPSVGSVHTIQFGLPNGMANGQDFRIAFDGAFDSTSSPLTASDITMTVGGNATTVVAGTPTGTNWGVLGLGSDTLSFYAPTNFGVASSGVIVLTIGSSTNNMLLNPSATSSYEIQIGGGTSTIQDSGEVRVAIIEQVTVSASVDTTLSFSVSGVGSGAQVNGTSTSGASTNVSLPFGQLTPGVVNTLAQRLNVTTNAGNGYSVTVETTGPFESTVGATIDGFANGGDAYTPIAWTAPSGVYSNPDTYGHWGITSTDNATTRDPADEFDSGEWAAPSTTPIVIMGHASSSDGTTDGVGSTTVGFQVEITALQEAGDDYSTELRYIATPVF
jgi:hypothetical protein